MLLPQKWFSEYSLPAHNTTHTLKITIILYMWIVLYCLWSMVCLIKLHKKPLWSTDGKISKIRVVCHWLFPYILLPSGTLIVCKVDIGDFSIFLKKKNIIDEYFRPNKLCPNGHLVFTLNKSKFLSWSKKILLTKAIPLLFT